MTHLGTNLEAGIGEILLNGDVTSSQNPVFYGLGLTQAANSSYLYVSLHTANPGDTAGGANEVSTSAYVGYTRSAVRREKSFASPSTSKWTQQSSSGAFFQNADAINFPICGTGSSGTITFWGLYDAATGGNLLCYGPLTASGATWNIGCVTSAVSTTRVFCRSHGLAANDIIRMYQIYNGVVNTLAGGTLGLSASVASVDASSPSLYFDIGGAGSVDVASFTTNTSAAFAFIKASSISLSAGKIPAIPAGGMTIRWT